MRGKPKGKISTLDYNDDEFVSLSILLNFLSFSSSSQVSAVNAWLEANRTFHIMRDHPSHNGKY